MAKWWAITGPAKTPLTNGVGEAAFTVTNVTATAVRGLVRVLPEGSAKPEMFKIVGESTLDWAPNETKSVTVQINGAGAPPGSYVFTFAVVSEADPSELSDRLSSAFDVGAAASGKKLPVGIIVGIVAGVLVIGGVLWWLLRPDPVDDRLPGATASPTVEETPTPPPTPTPLPEIPQGGCDTYDPNSVRTEATSTWVGTYWTIRSTDGVFRVDFKDGVDDQMQATSTYALATSSNKRCFVEHVEYWLQGSSLPDLAKGTDCTKYDSEAVERIGTVVTDGELLNVQLPTPDDAEKVLALALNASHRCHIAKDVLGEEVEYWL